MEELEIIGARSNNLKNISLRIPRNKMVVITGPSGSGKSSLAFQTLFAEGQRRYLDTLSSYARQFMGSLERPDVDKINGLSPVISIEQKTVSKNPRSTLGTITEIYDFLRLLFSKLSVPVSEKTGLPLRKYSEQEMKEVITREYSGKNISVMIPLVKGRKGHYRELFEEWAKKGYQRFRVDGTWMSYKKNMQLDRYRIHDVELVLDRFRVTSPEDSRLKNSLSLALKTGKGTVLVMDNDTEKVTLFSVHYVDPETGMFMDMPSPNTFSFNSPYGACTECKGLGWVCEPDMSRMVPDPDLSVPQGAIIPLGKSTRNWIMMQVLAILDHYQIKRNTPVKNIPPDVWNDIMYGFPQPVIIEWEGVRFNTRYEGLAYYLMRKSGEEDSRLQKWASEFTTTRSCPSCRGSRLKKTSLLFKINGKNIFEWSEIPLSSLPEEINHLKNNLTNSQRIIAGDILREISERVEFLLHVGLGYLTLSRPAASLSGGEAQRIRLATQIGSRLTGVMYILDEPSIGLHPRDNERLIHSLRQLRDLGNSVLVVEHDEELMRSADYLVDMGPGGGSHGGKVVAAGSPKDILLCNSLTADYLSGRKKIIPRDHIRKGNGKWIEISGCTGHNLKNINVKIPLGCLVLVTGVSGSGKSSLINETLVPALKKHIYSIEYSGLPYRKITGYEAVDKVIEIDQSPIGRTPRSNALTYTKVFDDIRQWYSGLPDAKIRGFKAGRFSFNVRGGRCEQCQGSGMLKLEMNFLPDAYVICDECDGKRYNPETLRVLYKGKNIHDVLNMSVEQGVKFFENIPQIKHTLEVLNDVGLGYLRMGQPSTALSGGEAQRVKLAAELCRKQTGKTIYFLDEPTTGLHFHDVGKLLDVLHRLVDQGNTVVIIEHHPDVIRNADYIIDLGPEGGEEGGQLMYEGFMDNFLNWKKENLTLKYILRHSSENTKFVENNTNI